MIILPDLPYRHGALEPVLSATTVRTHHGKHHARHVEVTNALLGEAGEPAQNLEDVVKRAWRRGARKLFNNAAKALNHGFYWRCMAPPASRPEPSAERLARAGFGDSDKLRAAFLAEGAAHFGSGWVWLTSQQGVVSVLATHDADTVFRMEGHTPLLVCDVWEHAYYLDDKNDRAAYLAGWWDRLVDWAFVERQYEASLGRGEAWRYPTAADATLAPKAAAAEG